MSPLRILHVVPYYEQAWAYGGIPRLATTLARTLAARGHRVTVCTTDVCDARTRAQPHPPGGVEVRAFPNLSNRLAYHQQFFTPTGMRGWLRGHAHEFDVAHLHACHNLPGAFAARALTSAHVPFVVSPNGTARPIERRILAKRLFAATVGRTVLRDADRVLAVSAAELAQLHALGIPSARLAMVPNPVDLAEYAVERRPDAFRQRHGIGDDPLVLFLGKLTPRKGVDVLVRAFARLAPSRAVLAIAGNDMGAGAAIDALIAQARTGSRIIRTGLLPGAARLDALAAADVVVYPSRDEIFGLVPLEALLCGAPVIVCDDSGCAEIIGSTGGGVIVTYGDVDALAAAMARVLDEPGQWRADAAAAAGRVRGRYSADMVCEKLEAVYRDVQRAPSTVVVPGTPPVGVSFVLPVCNGRRWLRSVVGSILAQRDGRPFEVIAVDDGSTDGSRGILERFQRDGSLRWIEGPGRGAAAAINAGIREARYPIVCQVDQDVILKDGWLTTLVGALDDPQVAAAQGHYVTAPGAGFWARMMGRDLELRYASLRRRHVNHVCTGNTAYRVTALHQVGLLDERLGYGYDNDLSYRLAALGHRLAFCRDARAVHRWREGVMPYLRQQYGVGYGRLDLVTRHPHRRTGDDVSGIVMMAHAPAMLVAVMSFAAAGLTPIAGLPAWPAALLGTAIVVLLAAERAAAAIAAWRRSGDSAALAFPLAHLARDAAWALAIVIWTARRVAGRRQEPRHSMARARTSSEPKTADDPGDNLPRLLAIVPAFNEAGNLRRVVAELQRVAPWADILVVNDGSEDETVDLLPTLGVHWLTLPQRVGVGGTVRTGVRYAARHGYDYVVRVDGDGQHRARDVRRLLGPVLAGHADAVTGSRFLRSPGALGLRRASQALLAACLTLLTGRRVTDPTSGLWLFGPRAVRFLARHHPTGYPEPELVLVLHRNRLRVAEVAVRTRRRVAGRTSLTATRAMLALARTLLALVIVPMRRVADEAPHD